MVLDRCGIKIELTNEEMEKVHKAVQERNSNKPQVGDIVIASNNGQVRFGKLERVDGDGEGRSHAGDYNSLGYPVGSPNGRGGAVFYRKATPQEIDLIRKLAPNMNF